MVLSIHFKWVKLEAEGANDERNATGRKTHKPFLCTDPAQR